EHFLDHHARRYGKSGLAFDAPARKAMMGYSWPGNVRELRNVVENAVLLSASDRIGPEHLSLS
ncbi:MAG: sigma-54-dependent Fis family transcriptional regulator, partial [Gammaproteobacteria bacterium]|nr:sigma-54-dependent Fis family transcriptional regulator [Gammaproteobacteria bacterium]